MTDLITLRSKTRNEKIKIDPNARVFNDSVLDSFINTAYQQLQKDAGYQWRENYERTTDTTVAGQQEYDLPSDFVKLDLIQEDNQFLLKDSLKNLRMRIKNFTNGKPTYYYIYGNKYGLYPIPNGAITIDILYFKRLPTITTSVDSEFPIDFDEAIASYAAYLAFLSVNKTDKAEAMLNDYNLNLNRLLNAYIYDDTFDPTFGTQNFGMGGYGCSEKALC